MGLDTKAHPEINAGALYEFGFHKALRQTKSVIVSMLNSFFSKRNKAFGAVMPEIFSLQNEPGAGTKKIHTLRDFPFQERKFPMILVTITNATEKKPYIGSDNLLYVEVDTNEDGSKMALNTYAGMAMVGVMLGIITTSPEERSQLAELVFMCFSHYYRGQFIYEEKDGSLFSITPASDQISFGTETEITDESDMTTVYVVDVGFSNFLEYHFKDFIADGTYHEVKHVELSDDMGTSLGILDR